MPIEVEQHFFPPATYNYAALASRLGVIPTSKINDDPYYDNDEGILAMRDFWLRCRNGAWELKIRRRNPDGTHTSDEIEDTSKIAERISNGRTNELATVLKDHAIRHQFTVHTRRASYKLGKGFTICVDHVTSTATTPQQIAANHGADSLSYIVIEAEQMVETPEQVPAAQANLLHWGAMQGLTAIPNQNKGLMAIKAFNPVLYARLPYLV